MNELNTLINKLELSGLTGLANTVKELYDAKDYSTLITCLSAALTADQNAQNKILPVSLHEYIIVFINQLFDEATRAGQHITATRILPFDSTINELPRNGYSPLGQALASSNLTYATQLIDKGANLDQYAYKDNLHPAKNLFAADIAIQNEQFDIARLILARRGNFSEHIMLKLVARNETNPDIRISEIIQLAKQSGYKDRQQTIILKNNHYDNSAYHPLLQSIASVMYFENDYIRAALLKELNDIITNKNPILLPLLKVIAFAAQGIRSNLIPEDKRKKLKIFFVQQMSVKGFHFENTHAAGLFCGSTIYIATFINEAMPTLLHELKHFADKEIYGSSQQPYRTDAASFFQDATVSIRKAANHADLQRFSENFNKDKQAISLCYRFIEYHQTKQNAELSVIVPEVLGYLGVEKGIVWLQKKQPELLQYYLDFFVKDCETAVNTLAQQPPPVMVATMVSSNKTANKKYYLESDVLSEITKRISKEMLRIACSSYGDSELKRAKLQAMHELLSFIATDAHDSFEDSLHVWINTPKTFAQYPDIKNNMDLFKCKRFFFSLPFFDTKTKSLIDDLFKLAQTPDSYTRYRIKP